MLQKACGTRAQRQGFSTNDILLRTHGPYHRHKSTKSG